jgi:hypothetical protein
VAFCQRGAEGSRRGASPDTLPGMDEGPRTLITIGLLTAFVGFLLVTKTRKKPLRFLFITLMTFRLALWIFALGVLAVVLGWAALRQ